jgi:hypothetical protein
MEVIGTNPCVPEQLISLGKENLLQMKMLEAAKKYGVSSHVIAPRVKNCL